MKYLNSKNSSTPQRGSAFIYILVAIALLAALTTSFMRPSSQQTSAQQGFKAISNVKSQVEFIRSTIQQCKLTFPSGDRGADNISGLIGTDNFGWPINPSSTYLASPSADNSLKYVRCPGNPGNSNNHAQIFSGSSGKFLPPPPDLFEEWIYYSGVDGVFFFISTNKTDSFLTTALQKLDDDFAECEADIIDATGGDIDLTSTAAGDDPICPDGSSCFRIWLITQSSAVYNGDTDGEETAEPCP